MIDADFLIGAWLTEITAEKQRLKSESRNRVLKLLGKNTETVPLKFYSTTILAYFTNQKRGFVYDKKFACEIQYEADDEEKTCIATTLSYDVKDGDLVFTIYNELNPEYIVFDVTLFDEKMGLKRLAWWDRWSSPQTEGEAKDEEEKARKKTYYNSIWTRAEINPFDLNDPDHYPPYSDDYMFQSSILMEI